MRRLAQARNLENYKRDSGFAKSAVADLDSDIAELGKPRVRSLHSRPGRTTYCQRFVRFFASSNLFRPKSTMLRRKFAVGNGA